MNFDLLLWSLVAYPKKILAVDPSIPQQLEKNYSMASKEKCTREAGDRYSAPCRNVRTTCRRWVEQEKDWIEGGRRSVAVRKEHIEKLAQLILQRKREKPRWIEWDEENWHYQGKNFTGTEEQRRERVSLYILALDAINFCFWPCKNYPEETHINPLEYDTLAVALKKLAEADDQNYSDDMSSYAFSPGRLAQTTMESMTALLEPHLSGHYLDNMARRAQLWKEVGEVLLEHFGGSAMQLIAHADGSAPRLVELIFSHFPGFRDEVTIDDSDRVVFLKRAQIFVGDVNAGLKLNLKNLEHLTTFADYRVPQILRHFEILEYSPELSTIVDSNTEIPMESPNEISIRAATVVGVEELVKHLNAEDITSSGPSNQFNDVNVDWYLWQVGEKMHHDGLLKPFHKVRTHFY